MKTVITISRETGSGGHSIGQMLAERLGYDFYDARLVDSIAAKLHTNKDIIAQEGEYMDEDMEYNLMSGIIPYFSRHDGKIPFELIQKTQRELICDIAAKQNCVIVGRNSDEILKDNEHAFHVFVHASMDYRVKRVIEREAKKNEDTDDNDTIMLGNVPVSMDDTSHTAKENQIRHELELKDKTRAAHYNYFSNRTWGMVSNYNLMVDTSVMTEEQCCDIIIKAINSANMKDSEE